MKRMKNVMFTCGVAVLALSGCGKTYTVGAPENTGIRAEEIKEEEPEENAAPDTILNFQVVLGEDTVKFPMSLQELQSMGYEIDGLSGQELEPQEVVTGVHGTKDGVSVELQIYNSTADVKKVGDCKIGGVFLTEKSKGSLSEKIQTGITTAEEIEARYGAPDNIYDTEEGLQYSYEKNTYEAVRLYFDKESRVLQKTDVHSFQMDESTPADVAETPDTAGYAVPDELGTEVQSGIVEFDKVLYRLPVPVAELVKNGWSMQEGTEENVVKARSVDQVVLTKGENQLLLPVQNDTDQAKLLKDCQITKLFADQTVNQVKMRLPKDIEKGMTEEELKKALDKTRYETEDMETMRCYIMEEDDKGGCRVEILTDLATKKVAGISVCLRQADGAK